MKRPLSSYKNFNLITSKQLKAINRQIESFRISNDADSLEKLANYLDKIKNLLDEGIESINKKQKI